MSLLHFITKCRTCKAYYRRLVVRAIEDACVLLMLGVAIWTACVVAGYVFRLLGVA